MFLLFALKIYLLELLLFIDLNMSRTLSQFQHLQQGGHSRASSSYQSYQDDASSYLDDDSSTDLTTSYGKSNMEQFLHRLQDED